MVHEQKTLNVRGKSIEMLVGGEGPDLLYMHSAGGEIAWLPFFESLSSKFKAHVPAHPGFSNSSGLEEIDSIEDIVFHTTDLMKELDLKNPAMVGLSLGGWISAEFATRYSERISSLVLIAPVGMRPPEGDIFSASPKEMRQLVFSKPESDLAQSFIPDQGDAETMTMAFRAKQATARVGWNPYLHNRKLEGRLYRIAVPTLIIGADKDVLVSEEHCRLYENGIANSKFVNIEGAGHAVPFERPQDVADAVISFLVG